MTPWSAGLVDELPLKHRHPVFAPQFELWKGGPRHRSRLTAECELVGLGHDAATAALLEVQSSVTGTTLFSAIAVNRSVRSMRSSGVMGCHPIGGDLRKKERDP